MDSACDYRCILKRIQIIQTSLSPTKRSPIPFIMSNTGGKDKYTFNHSNDTKTTVPKATKSCLTCSILLKRGGLHIDYKSALYRQTTRFSAGECGPLSRSSTNMALSTSPTHHHSTDRLQSLLDKGWDHTWA